MKKLFGNPQVTAYWITGLYLVAFLAAEAGGIVLGPVTSMLLYVIILGISINAYLVRSQARYGALLIAFALCALFRIASIAIPMPAVQITNIYIIIGIPMMIGMFLAFRLVGLPRSLFLPGSEGWITQIFIALTGIPFSIIGYILLRPPEIVSVSRPDWVEIITGSLILFVFVALSEEILFRGLLQHGAEVLLGSRGILLSSSIFAIMSLGFQSWGYALFVWFIGIFFGWCVYRTRTLLGTTLAHGVIITGMLIVLPVLTY